jgi:hypothetical protein
MSKHPARRARTVTAVLSATAFAGIASGLAATHAGASSNHPSSTPATTTPPAAAPGGSDQGGSQQTNPFGSTDDGSGSGWTATPTDGNGFGDGSTGSSGSAGSTGLGQQANHGQSGAS